VRPVQDDGSDHGKTGKGLRGQAGRFGIRAIPTQVFFNEKGKEVYRHVGFMSEEDIAAQLEKMGVR
jgi:thioredoxin 1